jgi:5-methylcytosine-specific restriction endonuclease McrA
MSHSSASRYCKECKRIATGEQFYTKLFYKNREIVLERDENMCQCCGCSPDESHTNSLCVHHIDVNRLNNSLSNLITLCTQCHLSLHSKYGKYILRRSNIYKLFSQEKSFGEFGKINIYGSAKKLVKRQFGGKPKLFFKTKSKIIY